MKPAKPATASNPTPTTAEQATAGSSANASTHHACYTNHAAHAAQAGATSHAGEMIDVLVVGQGIAGSLLAWTLLQSGLSVRVVDDGHKTCASVAAAGMVNPVIGQRLNKAWEIEKCLPVAKALFTELEQRFAKQFFFPKKILRIINTEKEAEFLQKRLDDPAFSPFFGTLHPPHSHSQQATVAPSVSDAHAAETLRDEFGSIEIIGGGYLETVPLLSTLRQYFADTGVLIEAAFNHSDLQLDAGGIGVTWQGLRARRVIFAEGWRVLQNPFFSAYSFQATKGQILTVRSAQPLPDFVVNRAKWLIPQGQSQAWIGSTYERDQTEPTPTAEGAAEILGKVQSFIPNNPLEVVSHRAGIRLASYDHIPRVGFLPSEPRIGLFNAFSSKGNCFVPYLAQCIAQNILHDTALPARADIAKKKIRKGDNTASGQC